MAIIDLRKCSPILVRSDESPLVDDAKSIRLRHRRDDVHHPHRIFDHCRRKPSELRVHVQQVPSSESEAKVSGVVPVMVPAMIRGGVAWSLAGQGLRSVAEEGRGVAQDSMVVYQAASGLEEGHVAAAVHWRWVVGFCQTAMSSFSLIFFQHKLIAIDSMAVCSALRSTCVRSHPLQCLFQLIGGPERIQ
ncbi:hypothetical protein DsansV1_C32g0223281 [Dioscorea sansibarensis]